MPLQNADWVKGKAPGEGNPTNGDSGKPAATFSSFTQGPLQADTFSGHVVDNSGKPEAQTNDPDGDND